MSMTPPQGGSAPPAPVEPPRRRPALRSLLTRPLRVALVAALLLAVFMLANTLYLLLNRLADAAGWELFAVGPTSLPQLFQAMVLTHTGIGLLLAALMLGFLVTHLPIVWKRRHRASIISGLTYAAVGLLLVVTGLFILTAAASREHRWAWWAHVIAAALVPAGYVVHRIVSYARPPARSFGRFGTAVAGLTLVLVAAHSLTKREIQLTPEAQAARARGLSAGPGGKERQIVSGENGFVPAAWVPPESPFFPSALTTISGWYIPARLVTRGHLGAPLERLRREIEEYGFVHRTRIGAETCVECHADIVAQWEASAHRFASFNNPFYEATINDMRERANEPNPGIRRHIAALGLDSVDVAEAKSKWCGGCHDPAIMITGRMADPIDRTSREAQAGITCLVCHTIDTIHGRTGNGNYNLADEQEDPYLFSGAGAGSVGRFLHDAALKAKPTVHKRRMLKPFFREARYCSVCHKVSLPPPVNNYRWLRGQNEFDAWHDSGIPRNAARTFYLPPQSRVCQDCHMPPEPAPLGDVAADSGTVRSHRFLAVNTALPFLRGDTATIRRIEEFLRDEKVRVDVFAVTREGDDGPVMAIDQVRPALVAGDRVTVDVVVRNQGVGHTFPGGTNDSNEGWLEFTVRDGRGRALAVSGALADDGHLDPMAHVYKALILDEEGQPIHRRNAQDIHVTVFANVVGPGTADIAHYEFDLPPELAGDSLTFSARLLWRKFDRAYTEFAYRANPEGFKQFADTPDLPVTEIAADEVRLAVRRRPRGSPVAEREATSEANGWVRYNDYGIGLLLEGNTRAAARAFAAVERLAPERIDGPLNLARTAFRDGNLTRAYEHLRRVEALEPANARAAWVWGVVLQEDGRYDQAAAAYQRVLEDFPEDRATWRNLGRTYYLDQQYERALEAFARVLAIDPEDRIAHFHRMLCYRALGRTDEAEAAARAAEYYSVDEAAQELTRRYRAEHPGANLMAQQIRTHRLVLER